MKQFYAISRSCPEEVAVFRSREIRDGWVNYQDEASEDLAPWFRDRISIPAQLAQYYIGKHRLYDRNKYIQDEFSEDLQWVRSYRLEQEIRQNGMLSVLKDYFGKE